MELTYYPDTKSNIDAIRITEKYKYYIITVYYFKKLLTKKIKDRFEITSKSLIDIDNEEHEYNFHKKDSPFEFHVHIKLKKSYLFDFLKSLKLEQIHLNRIFGEIKNKKFEDGSIMEKNGFVEIKKNKEYTYFILTNFSKERNIKKIFDIRGNWKEFKYGEDSIQNFIFFDHNYWRDKKFYMFKSMIRNIIDNRKSVLKLIDRDLKNREDIKTFHFIYTENKSFLHKKYQKNNKIFNMKEIEYKDIFTKINKSVNGKCFKENKHCFIIYSISILDEKIYDISYEVDFFKNEKIYIDILEGIMFHIVDLYFPPKNKIEKYNNFLEI